MDHFEQEKKVAEKMLQETFDDAEKFIKTLAVDYRSIREHLKKNPRNQLLRRIAVRNFCALVEGQIHQWKWLTLFSCSRLEINIEDSERALLKETSYDLDNQGKVTVKQQNLQAIKNFRFSSELFARVYGCSKLPNYKDNGWECLTKVFEVRNRLMHPKQASGIEVSDSEVKLLQRADVWLNKARGGLYLSANLKRVAEKRPSNN